MRTINLKNLKNNIWQKQILREQKLDKVQIKKTKFEWTEIKKSKNLHYFLSSKLRRDFRMKFTIAIEGINTLMFYWNQEILDEASPMNFLDSSQRTKTQLYILACCISPEFTLQVVK